MRRPLLAAFLAAVACAVQAQPWQFSPRFIPVFDAEPLRVENPFSGGINAPRVQFVDIDADGDFDLFVLDGTGSLSYFENTGTRSRTEWTLRTTDFQALHIGRWFRFVDVNADGAYDLFFGGTSGTVLALMNVGSPGAPVFEAPPRTVTDSAGSPMRSEEQCVPTFVDIDRDGDMDFLTGSSIGTITLYENTGSPQSPIFTFRTSQWQGIKIISPAGPPGTEPPHVQHGANALSFCDIDHNGTQDLFFGDLFTRGLLLFRNDSPDSGRTAHMHVDTISYPYNADSVHTSGFNAAALCDIDGDGREELFVGHLLAASASLSYFHNDGTLSQPDHHLVTHNYLGMIDAGSVSRIALGDVDGDSLIDLVAGSQQGRVQLYRNDGGGGNPEWRFVADSLVDVFGEQNIAPALADLDGDGRQDLALGTAAGTMLWYKNTSAGGAVSFERGSATVLASVRVGQNAAPAFLDLDGDGDLDLLVGQANGRLGFYRNDGDAHSPLFTRVSDFYDSIIAGSGQPLNSVPCITDIDGDGVIDLLVGRSDGSIRYFRNAGTRLAPHWRMVADTFAGIVVQGDAAPALADIDGDGDADLFVGTRLGGVQAFENLHQPNGIGHPAQPAGPVISVWPMPCGDEAHVKIPGTAHRRSIRLLDILGRDVLQMQRVETDESYTLSLRTIPAGWYVVRVASGADILTASLYHWK